MARLLFAPGARDDLRELLATLIEKAGRPVAAAYADRFRSTLRRIETFPSSGAPRPKLGASIRIAVVSPYILIYRTTAGGVQIVRVLHGRRKVTRRMIPLT